jgi:hypothetical protein
MILDDKIEQYTEIPKDEFDRYNVLQLISRGWDDYPFWRDNFQFLKYFLLKPERKRLSSTQFKKFLEGKERSIVAIECRLGARERSIIIGFMNKADLMHFMLVFG